MEPAFLIKTVSHYMYNPNYGDARVCKCGHAYERHFDFYESHELAGCKYCMCYTFKESECQK